MQRFTSQFWLINLIQSLERLAYWIVLLQMPIYIAQKDLAGGLHWEQSVKGLIFFWWALIQNLSPIITGGFADKFGRKKVMLITCLIMFVGFVLLAYCRDFYPFLGSTMLLGLGMGVFKPALQGSVLSHMSTSTSASKPAALGWGIYVTFVNVGYFLGPLCSTSLKSINWQIVFLGSAGITLLNAILLLLVKDDTSQPQSQSSLHNSVTILKNTFRGLVQPKVLIFLLLITGFTLNHMQFYETLPNFVADWKDTSAIAKYLPDRMLTETSRGTMVAFEWIFNINSTLLLLLVALSAFLTRRRNLMRMCSLGVLLVAGGLFVAGFTQSGALLVFGVFVLAIGEILITPRISEYFGSIAEPGSRSQYLGYANLAWLFGLSGGGIIGGYLYQHLGEKATFAATYLGERFGIWGIAPAKAMALLSAKTGLSDVALTALLWDTYQPWRVWLPFLVIGLMGAMGLLLYSRRCR